MLKKFVTMLLTMAMMVFCIPLPVSAGASIIDRVREEFETVVKNNEVITSTEFEGNDISCKYEKETQEYLLYFNDEEYKLNVTINNGDVMVDIVEEKKTNANVVYGQSPALALAVPLIPEIVAVIESCVIATVTVIGTTYLSTELLEEISTSSLSTSTKVNTSAANAAVSVMASSTVVKTEYDQVYFEATLQKDGTIFIGRLLTYKEAVVRLRSGYDIFATDSSKAYILAKVASPIKVVDFHYAHEGPGMRYDHYHSLGIRWYLSKKHNPHVWFV